MCIRDSAEGMAVECEKAGIGYDCIEDVMVDGIVVSSTYIRQLISQGDMERAARFLGHPYTCLLYTSQHHRYHY